MERRKAFTLIEMMLVVIIIGVLAVAVIPRFVGRSQQAKMARAELDIANIGQALDLYELDNGYYPTDLGELITAGKKYLKAKAIPKDPWDVEYTYKRISDSEYELESAKLNELKGKDGATTQ